MSAIAISLKVLNLDSPSKVIEFMRVFFTVNRGIVTQVPREQAKEKYKHQFDKIGRVDETVIIGRVFPSILDVAVYKGYPEVPVSYYIKAFFGDFKDD